MKMPKKVKNWLAKWYLKNYPLTVTTKIEKKYVILVKKGKIKEWRTYDENHNRLPDTEIYL